VKLPGDIVDLLWSYDQRKIDAAKDAKIVIMCVVRLGNWDQVKWLFSTYGWGTVKAAIEEDYFGARTLPVSVRAFWGNLFWPQSPPPELTDKRERWRSTRQRSIEQQDTVEVRQRLSQALANCGLTQKEFALLLGTSQSRLSTYLSGKVTPSATFLVRAERVGKQKLAADG
jgi:predicted XRE-type DNA-binding protein